MLRRFVNQLNVQYGYTTSTQPAGRREVEGKLARAIMKPMIFGNHQKLFMFLAYTTAIGSTVYMVFYHDYKLDDHCFMPIRQYVARKKKEFFTSSLNTDTIQKLEEQNNKEPSPLVTSSKQQTILK
ncbi:uncharacterized protein [Dysidea avara]|uniref:uncharacterized protein n=1 Tax=Dysidea avara TaxID=196820 RepID=UPI003332BBF3